MIATTLRARALFAVVLAALVVGSTGLARADDAVKTKPAKSPTTAPAAIPATAGAHATHPAPPQEPADDEIAQWDKSVGKLDASQENAMADKMTTAYGGKREDYLKERSGGKRSWGQTTMAHEIALRAHRPVGEVWNQRNAGKGWGEICKGYGFSAGDVQKSAKQRSQDLGGHGKSGTNKASSKGKPEASEEHGQGATPEAESHGNSKKEK